MSQPPGESPPFTTEGAEAERPGQPPPAPRLTSGNASLGRNPIVPHLVWEAILGLVALVLVVTILAGTPDGFLSSVLDRAGYLGLAAAGLALSFRTATPNLAIGSVAVLTGALGASFAVEGWGLGVAMAVAVLLSAIVGLVAGLLVAGLSVPAWIATLGVAGVIDMWLLGLGGGRGVAVPIRVDYPTAMWFGLFAVVSIGGGVLWWRVPTVRQTLSSGRRPGESGRWAAFKAGRGAVVGLIVSSSLAGLAGVALTSHVRFAPAGQPNLLTLTALAAVLLGGASVFGPRAGVLGTFLGVLIVEGLRSLLVYYGAPFWVAGMFIGLVIVLGLGVSRLLKYVTDVVVRPTPP